MQMGVIFLLQRHKGNKGYENHPALQAPLLEKAGNWLSGFD
jgi:hypothetical protein